MLANTRNWRCSCSHLNNQLISPATLAVQAAQRYSTNRRWNPRWLWIALVTSGFAVYLLLNWRVIGDALAFFRTRKESFE